jgi:predicted Rossmann fold flavoprotein
MSDPAPIADGSSWDVVVVGAGAAGLIAAIRAAERGRRTLLLEKNRRPGVKILMSGGTRCNLTQATDKRGIVAAFGKQQGGFLQSALAAFTPQDLVAFVEREGVATKVEPTGKIFPTSDRAVDVLEAFLSRLERSGAVLATSEPMQSAERSVVEHAAAAEREGEPSHAPAAICPAAPEPFHIVTAKRILRARSLLITTGGQSYPGSGTTGDGYAWARAFGHTVTPLRPALTPLLTHAPWVQQLQGVTLPYVRVEIVPAQAARELSPDSKGYRRARLAERRGSLLLTHFGLSGPVALDVSRVVSGHESPGTLVLRCDLLPEIAADELQQRWQRLAGEEGRRQVGGLLVEWLPRRLVETLLVVAEVPPERRLAELTRSERQRLVTVLKQLDIPLDGTRGYKKAEVTAGGVSLREVDSRTMESKLVPGLYFAGEVLDLDGPIGGYNFQAAFSTGWLAGSHV